MNLRRSNRKAVLAGAVVALLSAVFGKAQSLSARSAQPADRLPAIFRDVGIDQKLNNQIPLDLEFQDETGKTIHLGDYFGQKPVVLILVYYDCPMLCTTALNGLLESLKQLKFTVGDEFNVVTVSFDPTEKPSLAAAKKAVYVGLYGRPGAAAGWHFLTGSYDSIRRLTEAVGFHYHYDPATKQYIHATGIMVLTPAGKLSRYLYGIQYPSGTLRLSLVDASAGKIGNPVDAILLYCCQYDPQTGKYSLVISRALKIAGLVTVLSLGTMMIVMFRAGGNHTGSEH
ncbi:MAG TPA: SCO family protein [Terriglobia bacterium]|nr:SCO family protein [Terriglobia bacterium]